ncbi:multicopper oxidase family protein [Streptomyces sp. cmx-18-6]|uniref:multicopper oxidase family protein n=1 Tax=Streptomyces sp. cmx-18-6 TaxID=2790930 RepID=UPI003980031A
MPSRRQFVIGSAAAAAATVGGGAALLSSRGASATPPEGAQRPGSGGPVATGVPRATSTNLTKFADALRIPPVLKPGASLTIRQKAASVLLHSQLPPTPLWTYEGSFPGPTIDLSREKRLTVSWRNEISGAFPVTGIKVPFTDLDSILGPGRGSATRDASVAALPAWTVVHVHGAITGGGNDGWTENGVSPGDTQLAEYPNMQRSSGLWYHDHAMNITAFTVFAGLAGTLLIRDPEEAALNLPKGDYEIPLMINDRNLDTDDAGVPTGRLLHKIGYLDTGIPSSPARLNLPFIGPYNLVNGVIWPHLKVKPRWYRFRILNAANTRPYTLSLQVENANGTTTPVTGALVQIGSDHGLLPSPVPASELTLHPAERADVLINFAAFRGKRLRLVNTNANGASPLGPDIMQFRVDAAAVTDPFSLPATTSPSFVRLTRSAIPAGHTNRWIAFGTSDGTPLGHPEMWELSETKPGYQPRTGDRLVRVKDQGGTIRTFRKEAAAFDDKVGFHVASGAWEVWNFLHLVGPGHPMHVHLLGFQALNRDIYTVTDTAGPGADVVTWNAEYDRAGVLGDEEKGWKDTIRVEEHELVSVAGQFTGATGRFVYHCHILEHEDEGMMRPFVVAPQEILDRMPHSAHHH